LVVALNLPFFGERNKKQIPFGDDNQKSKRKAKAKKRRLLEEAPSVQGVQHI
jgi:hypothetical protein